MAEKVFERKHQLMKVDVIDIDQTREKCPSQKPSTRPLTFGGDENACIDLDRHGQHGSFNGLLAVLVAFIRAISSFCLPSSVS